MDLSEKINDGLFRLFLSFFDSNLQVSLMALTTEAGTNSNTRIERDRRGERQKDGQKGIKGEWNQGIKKEVIREVGIEI